MMRRVRIGGGEIGGCQRRKSLMTLKRGVNGHGRRGTELMDTLFKGKETIPLLKSFSPAPATATGLRSTMPVRTVSIGRPFRARTTTTRGTSASIRATTARTAAATATAGSLFVLSKGSPNSERM